MGKNDVTRDPPKKDHPICPGLAKRLGLLGEQCISGNEIYVRALSRSTFRSGLAMRGGGIQFHPCARLLLIDSPRPSPGLQNDQWLRLGRVRVRIVAKWNIGRND